MGTTCSSHQRNQRQWCPSARKRKGSSGSCGSCGSDGNGSLLSSLRHSVLSSIPDSSIAASYPVEENFVHVGDKQRCPKSLAALATESLCRSLPYLNEELPAGLPQDVVNDIVHSLISQSAINATTLRALRNCELSVLSLANSRGVTDSWLEPLANTTYSDAASPYSSEVMSEGMALESGAHDPTFESVDAQKSESAYVVSASSNPLVCSQRHNETSMIFPHDDDDEMLDEVAGNRDIHDDHHELLEEDAKQSASFAVNYSPTFVTTNVTLLDLRGSTHLTDEGLLHLSDLSNLEVARLDNCHSIQGRGLLAFASSHQLHTLSLANCRRLTDEAVINFSHLLCLQALSLHGCRCLTDRCLAALSNLYNLSVLDISQCDLVTDEGIEMLESLEALEEIGLGWCRQLTDRALETIAKQPQRSSNVRILRLARCNLTDEGISELSRLQSIEELDLNGCARITSPALGKAIERLERLTILNVSYCPGILRSSWQGKINNLRSLELCYSAVRDTHILRLRHLPALEELYLDSCPISDSAIGHLADSNVVPNLSSLDLADTDLTDIGLAHIAKFEKLTRLSLFYCNISNSGLRHLSRLTNLCSLNLDSRDISDEGLRHLPKQLKSLDIFSGRITDTGCGHIAKITSLETLELCGGGVGDLGCTLLATLENLTSLNLSQNERISNRGAAALAALDNLEHLNVSNTRVNSSALRFFSGLRKLRSLAIYGCEGVDNTTGVTNLQNDLPTLKCIRVHTCPEDEGKVIAEEVQSDGPMSSAEMRMRRDGSEHMNEGVDAEYSDHD
ncbi:hypothetical protein ACA910_012894 [Epithemia clementina (nom. ined.)]